MNEEIQVQETAEAIDDGWGDEGLDLSDVTDDEADAGGAEGQPEGEENHTEPKADEKDAEAPVEEKKADQSFTLNYMGENRTVTRDEVVTLAQKGMDYDRIRQGRDDALAEKAKLDKSVSFMAELAKTQGTTLDEMLDGLQAQMISQKENIPVEAARERVRLARREHELSERENALKQKDAGAQMQKQAAEKRDADIRSFVNTYPGVDPKNIPQEVWGGVAKGATLTEAYARYENRQLKLQLEASNKNRENEARSAGSRTTDGQKDKTDPIDKYWDED